MNNDLISRSALLVVPNVNKVTEYDEAGFGMSYNAVSVETIEAAPAVDAEVVRHGKWKPYYEPMECFVDVYLNTEIRDVHMGWICSECGRYEQHDTAEEMPYCHCGAKMDSEVEGC